MPISGYPVGLGRPIPREVSPIRKMAPINLILHHPETAEDQAALARRAAEIHAATVIRQIRSQPCPQHQQLRLLEAVISVIKASREQA